MDDAKLMSEECSVVTFYGINTDANAAAAFYQAVVRWFTELGCPPDKLSVHGPGHSGKPVSFARVSAKLQKAGFEGVTSLSVTAMTPGGQIPVNDWLLMADWSVEYSYALVAARSSLATLSNESMLPLAQTLAQDSKPMYGIGYTRPHRLGPAMYAIGICQGLGPGGYGVDLTEAEREEADSISRWGDGLAGQVWRDGLLRDVYPWNFLTKPQFTKPVGGVPLEQWIRQDTRRGTLGPLCEGVSLWEVGEAHLPAVRQALHQAGVIFDWRKYL
jgi:hypothetical protein